MPKQRKKDLKQEGREGKEFTNRWDFQKKNQLEKPKETSPKEIRSITMNTFNRRRVMSEWQTRVVSHQFSTIGERQTSWFYWNTYYTDRSRPMRDLESIGHGINVFDLKLYPMLESGGYDFENGCPLDEADDLSALSRKDKEHLEFIRFHRTKVIKENS